MHTHAGLETGLEPVDPSRRKQPQGKGSDWTGRSSPRRGAGTIMGGKRVGKYELGQTLGEGTFGK